jgi:translin
MKNLNKIVDKIERKIDDKDRIREKAIHTSRDIIILCRKAIQRLHRNSIKDADNNIKKASAKLAELYDITKRYPDIYHSGYVENASQEFVEAHCLINIMLKKNLPDPDHIQTTYSSYLCGLCDVVGELRRKSLDNILEGKSEKSYDCLKQMEEIYDAIIRFDYPSGLIPIKKKQDMVRNLIEKTKGELAVASCEQRIEYKTDEFRGILDKINSKSIKGKNKKKSELDIDKVW